MKEIKEISDTDTIEKISEVSHTFDDLYYQRMILFLVIVKFHRDLAWKSRRHSDGTLCYGGSYFIVGITTPKGDYTYHYKIEYYDLFDCKELDKGKVWDGHTDEDVTRLLSLVD